MRFQALLVGEISTLPLWEVGRCTASGRALADEAHISFRLDFLPDFFLNQYI